MNKNIKKYKELIKTYSKLKNLRDELLFLKINSDIFELKIDNDGDYITFTDEILDSLSLEELEEIENIKEFDYLQLTVFKYGTIRAVQILNALGIKSVVV